MTDQNNTNNGIHLFADRMPDVPGLKLPPPVFELLGGEFLETTETSMKARYPVRESYQNPFGYMQGGLLSAIMDNTIGPLSILVAPPSVTTQFNTTYLRPVTPDDDHLIVVAELLERTRRQLFFKATVYNPAGKIVCFCQANHTVVGE
ncbi:MAG: PaaI family thioesterase [Chloroflexota bacterium]